MEITPLYVLQNAQQKNFKIPSNITICLYHKQPHVSVWTDCRPAINTVFKKNKVKCNTRGESSRIKLYVVKTRVLHFTLFF